MLDSNNTNGCVHCIILNKFRICMNKEFACHMRNLNICN